MSEIYKRSFIMDFPSTPSILPPLGSPLLNDSVGEPEGGGGGSIEGVSGRGTLDFRGDILRGASAQEAKTGCLKPPFRTP